MSDILDKRTRVYRDGRKEIETVVVHCGEAYCDACGDCIHCYGYDDCHESKSGRHFWVEYEGEDF